MTLTASCKKGLFMSCDCFPKNEKNSVSMQCWKAVVCDKNLLSLYLQVYEKTKVPSLVLELNRPF